MAQTQVKNHHRRFCDCQWTISNGCSWFFPLNVDPQVYTYKRDLFLATSGNALESDEQLVKITTEVAWALGMASNHFQPHFGECGLRWTIEALRYSILQGEPHTAAALALIPPHSPPRLQISGLFSFIEYIAKEIPIRAGKSTPSPFGTVYEITPAHHVAPNNLRIWEQWSVRQAKALLGYKNVWFGWQHSDVAPPPSPARFAEHNIIRTRAREPWPFPGQNHHKVYLLQVPPPHLNPFPGWCLAPSRPSLLSLPAAFYGFQRPNWTLAMDSGSGPTPVGDGVYAEVDRSEEDEEGEVQESETQEDKIPPSKHGSLPAFNRPAAVTARVWPSLSPKPASLLLLQFPGPLGLYQPL